MRSIASNAAAAAQAIQSAVSSLVVGALFALDLGAANDSSTSHTPITGGYCTASAENAQGGETCDLAFDGAGASTKWLAFAAPPAADVWLQLSLRPSAGESSTKVSLRLKGYAVVSANDCPERDPCTWVLEGRLQGLFVPRPDSNPDAPVEREGGLEGKAEGRWVALDARASVSFGSRGESLFFELDSEGRRARCDAWRLRVLGVRGGQLEDITQLAGLELFRLE